MVLVAAIATLGGCAGGDEAAPVGDWVAAPPSAPPTSPKGPARLAKISSACKLLSAETVVDVLGSKSGSKLKARELPVDKSDGEVAYSCAYGKDGQEPFALTVSTRPDKADVAEKTIDNIAAGVGVETTPVEDLGAAGLGYVKDGFRVVAVTVPYEDDLRLVIFAAPQIVPQQKLEEVTGKVLAKI